MLCGWVLLLQTAWRHGEEANTAVPGQPLALYSVTTEFGRHGLSISDPMRASISDPMRASIADGLMAAGIW